MSTTRLSAKKVRNVLISVTNKALNPAGRRCFSSSSTILSKVEDHDIVIVGGGPAGLALAAALAASEPITSTQKITLLEAGSLDSVASWAPPPGVFSNRVSSITSENVSFLSGVGVWPQLDLTRVRPIEEMQVWDGISDSRITFNSSPSSPSSSFSSTTASTFASRQFDPMATLVENLNLQKGSLNFIKGKGKAVELLDKRKVVGTEPGVGGWPVVKISGKEGNEERSLRARLLIGADGFNSPVRTYSNIQTFGWPYAIHGVVASLSVSDSNLGEGMTTAWQRFLPEGPIAFLPMSDNAASMVWSTSPALATALKAIPLEALPMLVNAAFSLPYASISQINSFLLSSPAPTQDALASLIERLTPSPEAYDPSFIPEPLPPLVTSVQKGTVASFPLKLSHVDSYLGLPKDGIDLRTVLVGDAAHTVNPLGGQGLNMGLADAKSLVKTIEKTVIDGGDIGSYNSLRPYARARYLPNHLILSGCDHLSSLYGTTSSPIVWARSNGLEIINELDSVKNFIMGGVGGSATSRSTSFNPWGSIGTAIEGVGNVVQIAKGVAGLATSQLVSRFASRGGREAV
ncbi:ubiquinone biosynthesis hydrox [Meredithblackwellia eburnea MCA 4105]